MECNVVYEESNGIVQRSEQIGHFVCERRQLIRRRTLRSQSCGSHFKEPPGLIHLFACETVQRRQKAERLGAE